MIDLFKIGVTGATIKIELDEAFEAIGVDTEGIEIVNKYLPILIEMSQEMLTVLKSGAAKYEYEEEIR